MKQDLKIIFWFIAFPFFWFIAFMYVTENWESMNIFLYMLIASILVIVGFVYLVYVVLNIITLIRWLFSKKK